MKKVVLIVLAVLCAVFLFGFGPGYPNQPAPPGAWSSIGPFGGNICGLARNPKSPSELYAASSSYPSQIFRSVNNGSSWTRQSVISAYVYDLAVDPKTSGTIYLLCDNSVQVSKDKGKTFSRIALPSGFQGYDGAIAIHPTNPKIIAVCGNYIYDQANWRSELSVALTTNGGATWTIKRMSQPVDYGYGRDIAFAKSNPAYIYVCGFDYKDNKRSARIFVSKNGGSSWTSIGGAAVFQNISPACFSVHVDPRDPEKAWVGHYGGIARTSNAGGSWTAQKTTQITNVTALATDGSNPNILYAGAQHNYQYAGLKSTDGGSTWTAVTKGLYGECRRVLAAGPNVHLATRAGVFRSRNGGAAWATSHTGIRASSVAALGIAPSSPKTIYAGIYGYALLKTVNGGAAWAPCPSFSGSDLVASVIVHPTNANTLYVKPSG